MLMENRVLFSPPSWRDLLTEQLVMVFCWPPCLHHHCFVWVKREGQLKQVNVLPTDRISPPVKPSFNCMFSLRCRTLDQRSHMWLLAQKHWSIRNKKSENNEKNITLMWDLKENILVSKRIFFPILVLLMRIIAGKCAGIRQEKSL